MFHGRRRVIGNAAIVLVSLYSMVSYGYTPEDANEHGNEICAALTVARGAVIARQAGAEIEATNSVSDDENEPLAETLALGEDKWSLPDFRSNWRAGHKAGKESGGTEFEFLPRYDAEQANRQLDLVRPNNEEERTDLIEVFRFGFGRSP